MRILFMGTPDFAVASLRRLVEDGHEICGVFTQPDKPKNRGHKLLPTPVKEYALSQNLPVYQPEKMRDGTALTIVQELVPELIVVAAYGRILPGFFANEAGVLLEGGDALFVGNARGYVRLNLAMPRSVLRTGLERMRDAIRRHHS